MWLDKVLLLFKIKDLRKKILFVLAMMVVFRFAANIPIPGIDISQLRTFFEQNQLFGLMNIFTGGALSNFSIVMLGLGPYITSVIILQLLTMIFPQLERMYKEEGEQGRQKFTQYGRMLTVPLAALQGYAMLTLLRNQGAIGEISGLQIITSIFTITAGAIFLMWLGELISERGIGNGISLLIFAGIVARTPMEIRNIFVTWDPAQLPSYFSFLIMALVIIIGVVIINEGRRNIPVSYAKRVKGHRIYGGVSTYLPMNVNPAGVIPIIFALSIMLFPGMIANFLAGAGGWLGNFAQIIANIFQNPWLYGLFYFTLVILFTFFYTMVTFDPKSIASNLQKMGGFIPGIRPGQSTAAFIRHILNRVLVVGAIFLGLIAVMPSVVQGATGVQAFTFAIGGTALLIVVAVVLELRRQINAQLTMREYEEL